MTDFRPTLKPYSRDASVPLRLTIPSDTSAHLLPGRRAVWSAYLGTPPVWSATVPMATTWIPLVTADTTNDATAYLLPGSFYPVGFRDQVLAGCALPDDPVSSDTANPVGAWLRERLADPGALSDDELVRCAVVTNLLSQYRRTVEVFGPLTTTRQAPRLFREVARAWYAAGGSGEQQAAPFAAVAESSSWDPFSRLGAAIRLIAHYSRSTQDVEQAARWCRTAQRLHQETDDGSFFSGLYRSHLDRALALHHWRRRDETAMVASLASAAAAAVGLQDDAPGTFALLAARHAERLVLEAQLKAFTGHPREEAADDAARAADRILEIDPADPYATTIAGDTYWVVGQSDRALDCYARAARAGTLLGAQAAIKAAAVHDAEGFPDEARTWFTTATDLDGEAA